MELRRILKAADGSISQSISNASAPAHGTEITGQKSSPSGTSSAGHGWWGGLVATASAAVKTAEAAVKEIQQNEEAKRWTQQVKGNVGALKGIGECDKDSPCLSLIGSTTTI